MFNPSSVVSFADHSKVVFILWILFAIYVYLCYAVVSVLCSHVIICWGRADLLALLCAVFLLFFVTFAYDVPGQV